MVDADPVLLARVRADLRRSRTPRQVAARLRLEASDASAGLMPGSLPAGGKTVSREAICRWIYAAATLVERTSRFTVIPGLPGGKNADGLAGILIDHVNGMPAKMRGSLTWDQGTEMARHAALTLATDMPACFAHPHSPRERPANENTNGLIREYLPKGEYITSHQPYLDAIADELNDRPRAVLGYYTPREIFQKLLLDNEAEPDPVATTS
jgi:transposase InsO family protein